MDWHQGNPDIIHDAHLAAAAYSGDTEVCGWEKDFELSNGDATVYRKGEKSKVSFKGTELTKNGKLNTRDLGTDVLVGLGLQDHSNRFKKAVRLTDAAIKKYGKENVSLTGHSLGGAQAAYVSRKRGVKATGFGSAMGVLDPIRKRTYSHFHHVTTPTDPVSYFTNRTGRIGKKTVVPLKKWNPHALSNYTEGSASRKFWRGVGTRRA